MPSVGLVALSLCFAHVVAKMFRASEEGKEDQNQANKRQAQPCRLETYHGLPSPNS